MTNEIKKNVEDVDVDEDIERAVNEYRQKLIEFNTTARTKLKKTI